MVKFAADVRNPPRLHSYAQTTLASRHPGRAESTLGSVQDVGAGYALILKSVSDDVCTTQVSLPLATPSCKLYLATSLTFGVSLIDLNGHGLRQYVVRR
jgi:hypothetical protein